MSKKSKVLIVVLLLLALTVSALFLSQPDLFKGTLRLPRSVEKQGVMPRPGTTIPEPEPLKSPKSIEKQGWIKPAGPEEKKLIPDVNPDKKVIPFGGGGGPYEKQGVNPRPGSWLEGLDPDFPER